MRNTTNGGAFGVALFKDDDLVRLVVRKVVPSMVLVETERNVLSEVLWIDHVCRLRINAFNAGCIAEAQWPVIARTSERAPHIDPQKPPSGDLVAAVSKLGHDLTDRRVNRRIDMGDRSWLGEFICLASRYREFRVALANAVSEEPDFPGVQILPEIVFEFPEVDIAYLCINVKVIILHLALQLADCNAVLPEVQCRFTSTHVVYVCVQPRSGDVGTCEVFAVTVHHVIWLLMLWKACDIGNGSSHHRHIGIIRRHGEGTKFATVLDQLFRECGGCLDGAEVMAHIHNQLISTLLCHTSGVRRGVDELDMSCEERA